MNSDMIDENIFFYFERLLYMIQGLHIIMFEAGSL